MMMNSKAGGSGLAGYCYSADPGEAIGCGDDGGFLDDMFGDRRSSGDLFDLVWQGGAGGSSSGSMELQPASHVPSLSPAEVVAMPPSEDEMAAWLYPIVRGDDFGVTDWPDDQQAADHKRKTMEEKCRTEGSTRTKERRKKETTRKSHYAETHNRTEKRRRCKINEKFKTLQQLVPGCDKSNQVSTLDQTILYMKSLQQQIQAMSFAACNGMKPAAVYSVVVPPPYLPATAGLMPPAAAASPGVRPGVVLAPPPAMVPFGQPLLQYPVSMVSATTSAFLSDVKGIKRRRDRGAKNIPR